jgi:hypothetical protein
MFCDSQSVHWLHIAGGIRSGVIDELWEKVEPFELIAITAHEPGDCRLFYYADLYSLAHCMPAARYLAGHYAYGRMMRHMLDKGVEFVDLEPPALPQNEPSELMQRVVDATFSFHDGTLPRLSVGGDLRPFVVHCWAAQVMWYAERESAREMRFINENLIKAVKEVFPDCPGPTAAQTKLGAWSVAIMQQWSAANAIMRVCATVGQDHTEVFIATLFGALRACRLRICRLLCPPYLP